MRQWVLYPKRKPNCNKDTAGLSQYIQNSCALFVVPERGAVAFVAICTLILFQPPRTFHHQLEGPTPCAYGTFSARFKTHLDTVQNSAVLI
jgi:hypothetical protein